MSRSTNTYLYLSLGEIKNDHFVGEQGREIHPTARFEPVVS